jgi:hypothetical protein
VSCAFPELRVSFLLPAHAHAFSQLYSERIDRADQMDPKSILQWMDNPARCPASAEQLALARLDSEPTHVLLGAWSGEALVGFTHCTYLPAERLAFVPYLAVRPGALGTAGASAMLGYLLSLIQERLPGCDWVAFELSQATGEERAQARRRVFERHLRTLGLRPYRLMLPYRLPALEAEGGFQGRADLMLVRPWPGPAPSPVLAPASALGLVRAIYFGAYADALTHGETAAQYQARLEAELEQLGALLAEPVKLEERGASRRGYSC